MSKPAAKMKDEATKVERGNERIKVKAKPEQLQYGTKPLYTPKRRFMASRTDIRR